MSTAPVNFKKWIPFLAAMASFLLPAVAFAQGGPFDLPEDDLSRKTFIEPLFGPITGSGVESPLTSLMMAFNSALLVVGGILLAYTIVAGTMSTAHDGEMLGKKWSSMWIPIRTSVGVAAILPVIGGGWCVAQAIVVWLAMQGGGLANTLWNEFVGTDGASISASASYNPPTNLQAVRDAYAAMMINSACVAAHQNELARSGEDATTMGQSEYRVLTQVENGDLVVYYGRPKENMLGEMVDSNCGMLMLEEEAEETITRGDNTTSSELLKMAAINRPVIEARRVAFMDAKNKMIELGQRIANDQATQAEVNEQMTELLNSYSSSVSQAAKTAYVQNVDKGFLRTMKQDGWVMAGAFYMQLSKTQDMVTRAITNAPAVNTPPPNNKEILGFDINHHSDNVERIIDTARAMARQSNRDLVGGVSAIGADATDSSEGVDGKWVNMLVSWFINKDSAFHANGAATETVDFNENPIIMAKGLGEKMTATAWGALIGFTVLTGSGIGGVGSSIAYIFGNLFMLLLIPGATLSTYLPMLPYILWLGVVLGWAILLIEAVVAAPLWAVVHLAPDGDGVVGRGGQGYMLVLSLVLRPPLMIIGLAAAFVLMKPIGYLVNSTFVGAFFMNVTPGWAGLTQAIAGSIIYAVLMVIIVQRVFSLIHVIPDRLLRWIGAGGGGELGQEAGELDRGSNAKMAAALGAANTMNNSMIGMANNASRERIASRDREKHASAQRELGEMQAMESSRGDATDKFQDAQMAGDRAEAARSRGAPDEGLESTAAVAYDRAARQTESLAVKQAGRDNGSVAEKFRNGLAQAQAQEERSPGSVSAFMDAHGKQAQQAREAGTPMPAFMETLANRQDMIDKANSHRGEISSVREAKRLSGEVQEARSASRAAANEAMSLAKSSNSPAAQQFLSDVAQAKESGVSGAREQVAAQATAQARQDLLQNGSVEPFQQALINRDNHIQRAKALESRVAQPEAPQVDPLADEDGNDAYRGDAENMRG